MSFLEILLISVSLAADAFAVSICKGLSLKKINIKDAVKIGIWFGLFQALMPTIGFFLGETFEHIITSMDHWIAFILLATIGGKMVFESFSYEEKVDSDLSFKTMLILSIATSIDALVVGIAYVCAYGSKNAIITFPMIGIITFVLSFIGVYVGNKFGSKYKSIAEFTGGLILVLLGVEILFEHLGIL